MGHGQGAKTADGRQGARGYGQVLQAVLLAQAAYRKNPVLNAKANDQRQGGHVEHVDLQAQQHHARQHDFQAGHDRK